MKIKLLLAASLLVSMPFISSFAGGDVKFYDDPLKKTFISNPKQTQNYAIQQAFRKKANWQQFLQANGHWNVIFNEASGMPHRAFGTPVSVPGSDARSTAHNFMSSQLRDFRIPSADLNFRSVSTSSKYYYVNYFQRHQGLEVLFSNVQVKMTHDYRVMQFALDCYNNISMNVSPAFGSSAAAQHASQNVPGIVSTFVTQDLKVLPVPGNNAYAFHLVYEVMVENKINNIPGKYYTLIDAHTGAVLYRSNKVHHFSANTDVNVTGTLYVTHPYNAATVEPLRNLEIEVAGTPDYTDNMGFLGLSNTTSVNATVSLQGKWVKVQSNNITPSWNVTLNPGVNNIDVDGNTNIRQRSTYHAVNVVHDFMKTKYPTFMQMDNALPANVDVAGSCNAFYDGSSINFFAAGGGCNATALVADVCYHEYGHGINDKYYQAQGFNFQNGAMGEGYADIWALGITDSPILGIGFYDSDPNGYVRRYDIDKKVFPQDLIGEVHADGEIIAGCFWDTYQNLGNLTQMMDLFAESFNAGITGPDGDEGILFQDVLLEVLTLNDNDGNLANGTPDYCDITSAFAIHGITLGASVDFTHSEVLESAGLADVTVTANVLSIGASSVLKGFYRIGNSGPFTNFVFTNTTGTTYEGVIPAQNNGTIIEYYMGVEDDCGTFLNVIPTGAADANPNIPYYIMVGFNELIFEDFDTFAGNWTIGLPSDDAVTGEWIIDVPIPSYVGTALVQPDDDFTAGGLFCAFTGNASSPGAGAGENDVDDGKTTIESPVYNLTTYTNPAFTFYRWYSNDQGATPGTDFWQVSVSNDGSTFVPVENTDVADHSWRRFAFRVMDYVTPSATVSIRFVAEDANAGSLIEAALDDITLWDAIPVGMEENDALATVSVFPNPASTSVNINVGLIRDEDVKISLMNNLGQEVYVMERSMPAGNNLFTIDLLNLSNGIYQARIQTSDGFEVKKFNISR